jgi:hypothetical protein
MNNTLINNMNFNLNNNENNENNKDNEDSDNRYHLYKSFKSQKLRRLYYKSDNDLYFYSKIYFRLKKKMRSLEFFNANKISFSLVMTILMNDLFGNYDFYNSFIIKFTEPESTYYNLINIKYNSDNLRVKRFNIIFKQSLLQFKYCKNLFRIKTDFFNLDFISKYDLVMFHNLKIKTLCFLTSYLEIINLDKNFFLNDKINTNFSGHDKYDSFLLNNYYFKHFMNVNNIYKLYTSFLNYDNNNTLKDNVKIEKERSFLFFEDLNKKIILSKHADGCGVFSKKFNVSFKKHGNLMICFFRKDGDNIDLFTLQKYLPYVKDKTKLQHMKVPKSVLGDRITLTYNKDNKCYNFYELNIKKGTFSNKPIKIHLSYLIDKKIVVIVIDDIRIENLHYLLKGKNIFRFLKNSKKACRIAKFRQMNHDLVCDLLQIILPYEYIIIQVILYFELNIQKGGGFFGDMYSKLRGKKTKTNNRVVNMNLEQKLIKELGKPPKKDMRLFGFLKKKNPELMNNIKKTDKVMKQMNLSSLQNLNNKFNYKNDVYNDNNDISPEVELYNEDDKNECFQNTIRDTDSWLFQYYFYKSKFNECEYYYGGFEKCFKEKMKELQKWHSDTDLIVNKLNEKIEENKPSEGTSSTNKKNTSVNERRKSYISEIQSIKNDGKYFNELLMMFQFNKSWIDNYYNLKNN